MIKIKLLAMALLVVCSARAIAQQPIVIKFSHIVANDTPKGLAAEYFKKKAEDYTKGRVKVEVYANSTLYKDKEEMEALQLGKVQILAPSLAKFGPLGIREFQVFDLPFMFDSYDQLHRITEGPIGKLILSKLESKGVRGLNYWDNGFKSFSANTPIRQPSDLKGKKMRVQSSGVLEAQMRALGSIPKVLTFSDVYKALQVGVIDGTENPPSNFYTQKLYEVQKHMAITEHGYLGYAVIVNKKFWDGLPPELREQLEKAMNESTVYANRIAKHQNDQDLEKIKKLGKTDVYNLSSAERELFKQALLPVQREMAPRIGADLVQAVNAELSVSSKKSGLY